MNKAIRFALLVLAVAGFLLFLSFNVQNLGPSRTVTVGFNLSPWLKWSRVKGLEKFTEKWEVNVLSWSAAGLAGGVVLLFLRSRIKG
jgi:hypothetical protein